MFSHAPYILHERNRIFENVMIDALEYIAPRRVAPAADHTIGVIDMAGAIGRSAQKFTLKLELARHGAHIVLQLYVRLGHCVRKRGSLGKRTSIGWRGKSARGLGALQDAGANDERPLPARSVLECVRPSAALEGRI